MSFRTEMSDLETKVENMIKGAVDVPVEFLAKLLHKKAMELDPVAVHDSLKPVYGDDLKETDTVKKARAQRVEAKKADLKEQPKTDDDKTTVEKVPTGKDAPTA